MARLTRIVIPHLPHHVTQRVNRRQQIFFEDADYRVTLDLLAEHARAARVAVWAYCLMPDRVHLILVPRESDPLRGASMQPGPLAPTPAGGPGAAGF